MWAPAPLPKSRDRSTPLFGVPRRTQSLCPGCNADTVGAVFNGFASVADFRNDPGVIDAHNDLNVPSKIAQEQLGHASISTTLGIYTHAIPASHRDAVEAVEERLFAQLLSNVLESENTLASARPASDSVN